MDLPSSAGAYFTTLLVMLDCVTGGVHPPPSSGWADFSITMECTPESGHCHSVYMYSVVRIFRDDAITKLWKLSFLLYEKT